MREAGGGSIVDHLVGRRAARAAAPARGTPPSKGAVLMLGKALALETAEEGIRCNIVCPGPVADRLLPARGDRAGGLRQLASGMVPMGHLGEPTTSPTRCLFLASDESKSLHRPRSSSADAGSTRVTRFSDAPPSRWPPPRSARPARCRSRWPSSCSTTAARRSRRARWTACTAAPRARPEEGVHGAELRPAQRCRWPSPCSLSRTRWSWRLLRCALTFIGGGPPIAGDEGVANPRGDRRERWCGRSGRRGWRPALFCADRWETNEAGAGTSRPTRDSVAGCTPRPRRPDAVRWTRRGRAPGTRGGSSRLSSSIYPLEAVAIPARRAPTGASAALRDAQGARCAGADAAPAAATGWLGDSRRGARWRRRALRRGRGSRSAVHRRPGRRHHDRPRPTPTSSGATSAATAMRSGWWAPTPCRSVRSLLGRGRGRARGGPGPPRDPLRNGDRRPHPRQERT